MLLDLTVEADSNVSEEVNMLGVQFTAQHQPANLFSTTSRGVRSLLTPKRVAYIVVGALVCTSVVIFAHNIAANRKDYSNYHMPKNTGQQIKANQNTNTASPINTETHSASSSTNTNFSSTTTNGSTQTNLTVNGQQVDVPSNGASQHTITNDDGSTTTVNTSNSTSTNNSSNSVSVQVKTNGSSAGGSN